VPSPIVTEDHQTHNAMALVKKDAAILVADNEAEKRLMFVAQDLVKDNARIKKMEENISGMAYKNSAEIIAQEVIKLINPEK